MVSCSWMIVVLFLFLAPLNFSNYCPPPLTPPSLPVSPLLLLLLPLSMSISSHLSFLHLSASLLLASLLLASLLLASLLLTSLTVCSCLFALVFYLLLSSLVSLLLLLSFVSWSCQEKIHQRPPSPPFGRITTACLIQMTLGNACAAIRRSSQSMPQGLLLTLQKNQDGY